MKRCFGSEFKDAMEMRYNSTSERQAEKPEKAMLGKTIVTDQSLIFKSHSRMFPPAIHPHRPSSYHKSP